MKGNLLSSMGLKAKILITGSSGLIGSALSSVFTGLGVSVVGLDIACGEQPRDVADLDSCLERIQGCTGVVHLAAVSRVVWGEQDPPKCHAVNVGGTKNILDAALEQSNPPWVLFGSSREVYGQADELPATEDAAYKEINVYGRAKVEGERLCLAAREHGLVTGIVRFSNVFGGINDHPDRVTPAFAHAAISGSEIRVDGANHTFDFTYIDDVVDGIVKFCRRLEAGDGHLPPIHLVTGQGTKLIQLAQLARDYSQGACNIRQAPEREYDVAHFIGEPSRATELLKWKAKVHLKEGFQRFLSDLKSHQSKT